MKNMDGRIKSWLSENLRDFLFVKGNLLLIDKPLDSPMYGVYLYNEVFDINYLGVPFLALIYEFPQKAHQIIIIVTNITRSFCYSTAWTYANFNIILFCNFHIKLQPHNLFLLYGQFTNKLRIINLLMTFMMFNNKKRRL